MQVNFTLPTTYDDGTPLKASDIKQINVGIRPAAGTPGVYPVTAVDLAFTPDAQGISHEPLAAFGVLAPGDYIAAAETVMLAGGLSKWSTESAKFTIAAPVPSPPSNLSVA